MKNKWLKIGISFCLGCALLVAWGAWSLFSTISNGYEVNDGKVYYRSFDNLNWKVQRREVAEADPQLIRGLSGCGGYYGSDSASIFFEDTIILAADAATFRVLDWRAQLSRDISRVYWKSIPLSDDPENFQVLTRGYSRDSKHVFYANGVVEDADPDSFVVTGASTSHAHDANHQYDMGRKQE